MCTAFVKNGDDLVAGYNLDLAEGAWDYRVYAKPDKFYIGIKVGSTVYKTHGVNKNGNFGNLPYMNDPDKGVYRRGRGFQRIDLLIDRYISGKLTLAEVRAVCAEKELVNVPGASMHSLLCERNGTILAAEPGFGCREIRENYAVMSNFPLFEPPKDLSALWYGKDRFDFCKAALANSRDDFSAADGLNLLRSVRQEGEWATRVSFVYSRNENAVYYVTGDDADSVRLHVFS